MSNCSKVFEMRWSIYKTYSTVLRNYTVVKMFLPSEMLLLKWFHISVVLLVGSSPKSDSTVAKTEPVLGWLYLSQCQKLLSPLKKEIPYHCTSPTFDPFIQYQKKRQSSPGDQRNIKMSQHCCHAAAETVSQSDLKPVASIFNHWCNTSVSILANWSPLI